MLTKRYFQFYNAVVTATYLHVSTNQFRFHGVLATKLAIRVAYLDAKTYRA